MGVDSGVAASIRPCTHCSHYTQSTQLYENAEGKKRKVSQKGAQPTCRMSCLSCRRFTMSRNVTVSVADFAVGFVLAKGYQLKLDPRTAGTK